MWCEILQRKISSPKAIIHAYSPKCIRFSMFLPHTTSALRAPSPQGEGFDLCKSVKLRNKSECVRVTGVHFTLSALRAPLPKGEARACAEPANSSTNRNFTIVSASDGGRRQWIGSASLQRSPRPTTGGGIWRRGHLQGRLVPILRRGQRGVHGLSC